MTEIVKDVMRKGLLAMKASNRAESLDLSRGLNSTNLLEFLKNLDMGAYILDRDRQILFWNKTATDITGYKPRQVIGSKCLDDILCHEDHAGLSLCSTKLCPLFRSMETGKSMNLPYSVYTKTESNSRIPLNVTTFPIYENGIIVAGLEIFEKAGAGAEDMERALEIQKTLIPHYYPEYFDVFYHPSSAIGGDLLYVNDDWGVILDVSGHGISSALISTALRVLLNQILTPELHIHEVGNSLERAYQELGNLGVFFTGVFVKVEDEGVLIASYGHPAPILIPASGPAKAIDVDFDVLFGWGKSHSNSFKYQPLGPGDSVLLYSDGLIEVSTQDGLLGENGLVEVLGRTSNLKDLYLEVISMSTDPRQRDDISILRVFRRND